MVLRLRTRERGAEYENFVVLEVDALQEDYSDVHLDIRTPRTRASMSETLRTMPSMFETSSTVLSIT